MENDKGLDALLVSQHALKVSVDLLSLKIDKLTSMEKAAMAAIDDLNAAVATLASNFTLLDTAVQAEVAALKAALASGNTAAVEAAATNIGTTSAKMAADAAALTASLTP